MTQGCRSRHTGGASPPQSQEGELEAAWKRVCGKVAGFAATGFQVDSTLHIHSKTEPADLLQPRTCSSSLLPATGHPSVLMHFLLCAHSPLMPLLPPTERVLPPALGHMATATAQRGLATCRTLTGYKPPKIQCSQCLPAWFPNSFRQIPLPTPVPLPGRKGCNTWEQDKPQP